MIFMATWLLLAAIVSIVAIEKRRSGVRWFLYGMLAWPVALPHALLLRRPPASPANDVGLGK
jgi:hypothetical protein